MTNQSIQLSHNTQLLASEGTKEIQEIGRKLMKLTPGGKKLDAEQCAELAVAAYITGANPFVNEIYYMQGVGPYLGYQFYNRKATEQLAIEDPKTPPRIWFDERPADHTDCLFDESKGDVAWTVVLHDSVTHATWLGQQMEMFIKLTTAGIPSEKAWSIAESKAGPEPIWQASAACYGDEKFVGKVWVDGKKTDQDQPEKWDRNERAKKRAQKWALRKRFSNMVVPDPEMGDDVIEGTAREIVDLVAATITREEAEKPKRTEKQNLEELGFDGPESFKTNWQPPPKSNGVSVVDVRPWEPEELKRQIEAKSEEYLGKRCNPVYRNIIAKVVGTTLQDSDKSTKRYELFKWLVGNSSTKEWEECVVNAVQWWIGVTDYNDRPPAYVEQEIVAAHEYALSQAGQMKLGV